MNFARLTLILLVLAIVLGMSTVPSYAALAVKRKGTVVFKTDLENVVKSDATTLNIPVDNYFNFGGGAGATMWMEGLDRQTSGITCHSGNRCVGMEITNVTMSRRNQFSIVNLQNLVGQELFVSVWLYLPVDLAITHAFGQLV